MKPILFSTPMVQAILEGNKTQTRRVIKLITNDPDEWEANNSVRADATKEYGEKYAAEYVPCFVVRREDCRDTIKAEQRCIYYPRHDIGDVLYVRETFYQLTKNHFNYRADYPEKMAETYKWQPSIHMPKEAARIFLRVKNVRGERLQDIKEADVRAEGFSMAENLCDFGTGLTPNKATAGMINPWVFVYEFERIDKGAVNG